MFNLIEIDASLQLVCSKRLRCSKLLRVLMLSLIKKRPGFEERLTVLNYGFEKCKIIPRKPSASFVALKSEHIDQILGIMLLKTPS